MLRSSSLHVLLLQWHRDGEGWKGSRLAQIMKVNEMNKLKTIVPVTLLLLLVIGAMGVMVFWGLSLLNLSE